MQGLLLHVALNLVAFVRVHRVNSVYAFQSICFEFVQLSHVLHRPKASIGNAAQHAVNDYVHHVVKVKHCSEIKCNRAEVKTVC